MLGGFDLFISPVKRGSGLWENKQLIFIGHVSIFDKSLGRINRKDVFPLITNIALEPVEYEVWAYRKPIYHFLFFFEGTELQNGN